MGWSRFFRRGRWDAERARELRAYLVHEIDDNIARGMTPDDAARAAHRRLGNPTRIREEIYQMNTLPIIDSLWQDLRYGARLLRRSPTFSIVAVLMLALGTGANAAIFQLVNALRMRTLPVERPQELVSLGIDTNDTGRTGRFMSRRPFFSEPLYRAIREHQEAFTHVIPWGITSWNIATDGEYQEVQGLYVGGQFFEGLGMRAQIGRVLADADDQAGCGSPGAVLSNGFWRTRYGGSPGVLGQTIALDGHPFDIVGVAPAHFFGTEVGRTFDVAVPLCAEPLFNGAQSGFGKPDHWFLDIMARVKPGWSAERAQAHIQSMSPGIFGSTVSPRYNAKTAKEYTAFRFTATAAPTGVSGLRRAYGTELWVLLGATGLVLLVTCANLANLMLARATVREREIAVRLAIGASRRRIVRQMLSESLLIAALGALAGGVLAGWLSRTLVVFLSTASTSLFVDLSPDWRLFAFVTSLGVLACVLFGLSPALKATGANPGRAIQSAGRANTDSPDRSAVRRGLVVVQVALSMVLIVGALLFARSLQNLVTLDPGFRTEGVLAATVDIRRTAIHEDSRLAAYLGIAERVRGVAGVQTAAEALIVPLSGSGWNQNIVVDGEKKDGIVNFNRVGADYFKVLEMPLLAGRAFGPEDRFGTTMTAIVNESFATKYFGSSNPIGRTFQLEESPGAAQATHHVIGLVRDTKYTDLREGFRPIGYFAISQEPGGFEPYCNFIVRTDMAPASLTPALTRAVRDVAPGATVAYSSVATYVRDSLVTERVMAFLSTFFGLLAMLIATIGLYGVTSYMVSRRRLEIGIRMALGADRRKVVRLVLRESGLLSGIGIVAGTALAVFASRWAASLLFGLKPWDPLSIVVAVTALGLVSAFAAWIPARRASRVAPVVALRAD
jgi:putative ABC transport system permease protein